MKHFIYLVLKDSTLGTFSFSYNFFGILSKNSVNNWKKILIWGSVLFSKTFFTIDIVMVNV